MTCAYKKAALTRWCPALPLILALTAETTVAADYVTLSGKELYMRFCASCHGAEARGDGPVASSFKIEMPDLTLMANRQGSRFSIESVERVIDGRHIIGAHGTRAMPVWGEEFGRIEIGNPDAERATRTLLSRLAAYIVSLQQSLKSTNAERTEP